MNDRQKILIMSNSIMSLINFKYELLERLIDEKFEVYFSIPESKKDTNVKKLIELGCNYIETNLDRRSTNPVKDLNLIKQYKDIIKYAKPDVILSYTIKPNIYGSYVAKKYMLHFYKHIYTFFLLVFWYMYYKIQNLILLC